MLNLLVTCVNYSDYLEHSLKYNTETFDSIYVISHHNDLNTQKIVSCYSSEKIKLYLTNSFYEKTENKQKPIFNKGKALDYGLSLIPKNNWLLIGDADCIYPNNLKNIINDVSHDRLYTMYRYKVLEKNSLQKSVMELWSETEYQDVLEKIRTHKHNESLNMVKGYCQLFHFENKHIKNISLKYPEGRSCRHVDTIFSRTYFPKRYRTVLNTYCLHLGETCINWNGRKSKQF